MTISGGFFVANLERTLLYLIKNAAMVRWNFLQKRLVHISIGSVIVKCVEVEDLFSENSMMM